ncbi:MAG TPA: hypothetical protein VF810_03840 [Patescibacteria group bacterium]
MARPAVAETVAPWTYKRLGYLPKTILIPLYYSNDQKNPTSLPLRLALLGYGHGRRATSEAIGRLGEEGFHAAGAVLPFRRLG